LGAVIAVTASAYGAWRAIFWVNAALGLVCAAAYALTIRRREAPAMEDRPADVTGALLLGLSLGLLVLAIYPQDAGRSVFNDFAVPLVAAAAAMLALFAWRVARTRHPWLPRHLLRDRAFVSAAGTNFLIGSALVITLVEIPILARVVFGLDELGSAGLLAWFMAAIPAGALAGGWAVARMPQGLRWISCAGLLLPATAFVLMASWGADELGRRLWIISEPGLELVLCGFGFGAVIAPLLARMFERAASSERGAVSAVAVLSRTAGMLIGLACLSSLGLHRFYELQHAGPSVTALPTSPEFLRQVAAAAAWATESFLAEYRQIFASGAALSCAAALLALLAFGPAAEARPAPPSAPGTARG
jgi:MFS family permease